MFSQIPSLCLNVIESQIQVVRPVWLQEAIRAFWRRTKERMNNGFKDFVISADHRDRVLLMLPPFVNTSRNLLLLYFTG
ncbi:hypothetical protein [Methylacidiphilum kamchatkense]|nr:hypothetical protein [Methylacidiphilum kamchatkense]